MNHKEIIAEWVSRLRSGTIKQGKHKLGYVDSSRCCLGVLCDIAVENGIISEPMVINTNYLAYGVDNDDEELPHSVRNWAGLKGSAGPYQEDVGYITSTCLAMKNDGGKSFSEIADIIESRPEGLFKEDVDG